MTTLGERLKIARERKGMTQVAVRERTNINNKTLSGYEHNVSEPDIETLSVLADLYEVSYKWLASGKGSIEESLDASNDEEDEKLKEFMKDLTVWYHNEPEAEKDLEVFRRIMQTYNKDKN